MLPNCTGPCFFRPPDLQKGTLYQVFVEFYQNRCHTLIVKICLEIEKKVVVSNIGAVKKVLLLWKMSQHSMIMFLRRVISEYFTYCVTLCHIERSSLTQTPAFLSRWPWPLTPGESELTYSHWVWESGERHIIVITVICCVTLLMISCAHCFLSITCAAPAAAPAAASSSLPPPTLMVSCRSELAYYTKRFCRAKPCMCA